MTGRSPQLPSDTTGMARIVMSELNALGGRAGVRDLREAVATLLVASEEPTARWNREFTNLFGWTMSMLRELGEIVRYAADDEWPDGWYETKPNSSVPEVERERLRREWLDARWANVWENFWDE